MAAHQVLCHRNLQTTDSLRSLMQTTYKEIHGHACLLIWPRASKLMVICAFLLQVNLKDRLLGQSRSQHSSAVADRDTLRIELGKLGALFRSKQSGVDEQVCCCLTDFRVSLFLIE